MKDRETLERKEQNTTRPLISVIVPVYNSEKYIGGCIDSILKAGEYLKQNRNEAFLQLILVDDGSLDGSAEICRRYAEQTEHTEFYHQENRGVSTARNLGLSHAAGEYVSFVDGDDLVTEQLFAGLLEGMDEITDIVCCTCRTLSAENDKMQPGEEHFFPEDFLAKTPEEKQKLYVQLLDEQYGRGSGNHTAIGVPWGKLYRRSFLEKKEIRFDPVLKRMQDNVFNMEAFQAARAVRYMDRPLYVYRLSNVSNYIRGQKLIEPRVLNRIAFLRKRFFSRFPELLSQQGKEAYDTAEVLFFGTAMQYYAVNEPDPFRAVKRIRRFCENSVVAAEMKKADDKTLTPKRRLLKTFLRIRCYPGLYLLYLGMIRFRERSCFLFPIAIY